MDYRFGKILSSRDRNGKPTRKEERLTEDLKCIARPAAQMLPCKATNDSVDVQFVMRWPMRTLLVGPGKRY